MSFEPGRWAAARALFEELLDLPGAERAKRLAGLDDDELRARRRASARRPTRTRAPSWSARLLAVARRLLDGLLETGRAAAARRDRALPDPLARWAAAAWARSAGRARRRPLRAARRAQAAASAAWTPTESLRAVPARAADPGAARAPAHRAPARRRRDRGRAALLRHGARRGRADHRLVPRSAAWRSRRGSRLLLDACDAVRRAHRQPGRAPRPQAVEHPGDGGRRGQAARLRHRQAARRRDEARPRDRDARRRRADARLRRARADPRRAGHDRDRRLRARRAALRAADRARCRIGATPGRPPELAAAVDTGDDRTRRASASPGTRSPTLPVAEPSEAERRRLGAPAARRSRQHPAAWRCGASPSGATASAAALADDLRRHLAGRPVRARADTVGYRLGQVRAPSAGRGGRRSPGASLRSLGGPGRHGLAGEARRGSTPWPPPPPPGVRRASRSS